jgi:hypothetical protein
MARLTSRRTEERCHMISMKFQKPRFYLRKDPDTGWSLAFWKWRFLFNVRRGPRSSR